jgi:hypothetical protein
MVDANGRNEVASTRRHVIDSCQQPAVRRERYLASPGLRKPGDLAAVPTIIDIRGLR